MRNHLAIFRVALFGSTVALAALTPATAADLSRAARERIEAATGKLSSAPQKGTVSLFGATRRPATYTVLHSFAGGPGDGQDPSAEVTLDSAGNIYGTTAGGGANSAGTLFEIASGTETLLHSFGASGDGTSPDGALTLESNGDIIGTTNYGGPTGNGTIWKRAANGTYSILHSFTSDEGNFIRGRLVQDRKGNLYGTALFGGAYGYGTVFKYNTRGKLTVLHVFGSGEGQYPEHGVVRDTAGNLYGVTAFGGGYGNGTVYEIAANGTFSTLYSFTAGADGGFLYGGVAIDRKDGTLYGSTVDYGANGFGTVFKLASDGTFTTLYSFTGGTDGGNPEGDMLLAGKRLYSTATRGGDPTCGCGGVYEMPLTGKEKMLHAFTNTDPYNDYSAGLTASGTTFYGTVAGGGTAADGVVFSLTRK
ncbi:MAG TPA: choice-of-anchor tandem repeat GloVer-containing protein [Rhizomicrobium sp.]|nr:choice-of-anchor tandem repeat GloVer-containing protein [Rhizomicrobium sp.]